MCLYPSIIKNRKYTKNKKNGGVIPAIRDPRTLHLPVGCGKCMECLKQKSRNWQVRLLEDIKTNKTGQFVTLTFDTKSLIKLGRKIPKYLTGYNRDNAIAKIAVKLFRERWRREFKTSIRHWLITELGHQNTEHIHLHGILFTDQSPDKIREKWQYGFIWAGYNNQRTYINGATVTYITKYITKKDLKHKEYEPLILTSPGIGGNYTETYNATNNLFNYNQTIETYKTPEGFKIALPTYYRNKIYTDEEREILWLQKLDKQERWVNGERISVKHGMTDYFKTVEWHRRENLRLGYGTNQKDYDRKQYENELREAKWLERVNNNKNKQP